jgi:hypothetical protein
MQATSMVMNNGYSDSDGLWPHADKCKVNDHHPIML